MSQATRIMKASHFNIGTENGNMIHPSPIEPVDHVDISTKLSSDDARKRLGQTSWITG